MTVESALSTAEGVPHDLWIKTPLVRSKFLSESARCDVQVKCEYLQPSGSFKSRGMGNMCLKSLREAENPHFYCSSGGNAGLAVVTAAKALGAESTVVVPASTSEMMKDRLRAVGASEVLTVGKHFAEADEYLRTLAKTNHGIYCSPFDHPHIWEGHSTLVDELPYRPDAVVCSVGGGGLLIGIILGLRRRGWADVPIVAVETKGAASLYTSIQQRRLVTLDKIDTIATSLGATTVATKAFELSLEHPVVPFLVSDAEAAMASVHFANDHKVLVEAACAASLAPAYSNQLYELLPGLNKHSKVVIVGCGGSNITPEKIIEYKATYAP